MDTAHPYNYNEHPNPHKDFSYNFFPIIGEKNDHKTFQSHFWLVIKMKICTQHIKCEKMRKSLQVTLDMKNNGRKNPMRFVKRHQNHQLSIQAVYKIEDKKIDLNVRIRLMDAHNIHSQIINKTHAINKRNNNIHTIVASSCNSQFYPTHPFLSSFCSSHAEHVIRAYVHFNKISNC